MNLIAINELKSPRLLKEKLSKNHELMLTCSGKPVAFLLEIQNGKNPELDIEAIRDARSRIALTKLRDSARSSGVDKMTLGEINRIIGKARSGDQ